MIFKDLYKYDKVAVIRYDLGGLKEKVEVDPSYKVVLIIFSYKNSFAGQMLKRVYNGKVYLPKTEEIVSTFYESIWSRFLNNSKVNNYFPVVSVIVCTHNRIDPLKNCLDSLKNLNYSKKEIIIVDNAPLNDKTKELVLNYKDFVYVRESRKGLDIARNRGIKEAKGEIIAFTDDDAEVDRNWLNGIVKSFKNPIVCVVTGITMPYELETKAQIIFEQTNGFSRGFIRKEFSLLNVKPVGVGKVGAGVNMAVRKKYIYDVGLFDESLDGGTYSLSGGDQEFFYRVISKGYQIVYEPDALVWHKHRKEMKALQRTIYGYGVGVFAWWTKVVFRNKEIASLGFIFRWFFQNYIINLVKAPFTKGSSFRLSLIELLGTIYGPIAYIRASIYNKISRGV